MLLTALVFSADAGHHLDGHFSSHVERISSTSDGNLKHQVKSKDSRIITFHDGKELESSRGSTTITDCDHDGCTLRVIPHGKQVDRIEEVQHY